MTVYAPSSTEHLVSQQRQFLARTLSHELRTPLGTMISYPQLILDMLRCKNSVDQKMVGTFAEAILEGGMQMLALVENIEMWAELERRELSVGIPTPSELESCVIDPEMLGRSLQAQAERAGRGRDLTVSLHSAVVRVPRSRWIGNVIGLLAENALKFSSPASTVEVTSSEVGKLWILTIADQGRGIKEQTRSRAAALVEFNREQPEQPGMGLGLRTAALLAKQSRGSFSLQPGEGGTGLVATLVLPSATGEFLSGSTFASAC